MPFYPDYNAITVPIVDSVFQYDCQFENTSHLLIIRNALHVPAMKNDLIPSFIMREAGIQVNDTAKLHVDDPSTNDHEIIFPETRFRIALSFWGIFSYFPSNKPTIEMLYKSEEVYLLITQNWDPHTDAYVQNKENMLDWEGNIIMKEHHQQIILSEINKELHDEV